MVIHRDREVQIDVTSRHQHVSEKTRVFAMERAERLTRFNDRIGRIQVILDEEHDAFLAEVIVHVDAGRTFVGKESSDGYRSALDVLLVKLERQLKKDKEKRHSHKHGETNDPIAEIPVGLDEETYEDAVRQELKG